MKHLFYFILRIDLVINLFYLFGNALKHRFYLALIFNILLSPTQMQGSDSDVSIASDYRSSKGNLKGRLSGMFSKRSSSSTRDSNDRVAPPSDSASTTRPVSVTTLNVSNGQMTSDGVDAGLPPPTTPRVRRSVNVVQSHRQLERYFWFNIFLSSLCVRVRVQTSRPPTPTGNTPSMQRKVVRPTSSSSSSKPSDR